MDQYRFRSFGSVVGANHFIECGLGCIPIFLSIQFGARKFSLICGLIRWPRACPLLRDGLFFLKTFDAYGCAQLWLSSRLRLWPPPVPFGIMDQCRFGSFGNGFGASHLIVCGLGCCHRCLHSRFKWQILVLFQWSISCARAYPLL